MRLRWILLGILTQGEASTKSNTSHPKHNGLINQDMRSQRSSSTTTRRIMAVTSQIQKGETCVFEYCLQLLGVLARHSLLSHSSSNRHVMALYDEIFKRTTYCSPVFKKVNLKFSRSKRPIHLSNGKMITHPCEIYSSKFLAL
jgi:hypothetical protein